MERSDIDFPESLVVAGSLKRLLHAGNANTFAVVATFIIILTFRRFLLDVYIYWYQDTHVWRGFAVASGRLFCYLSGYLVVVYY